MTEMTPATSVRRLLRGEPRAALGTVDRGSGAPYVSLVMLAVDHDASPILLLSDLADHTANLKADARVSLLLDGTADLESPLAGSRATIQGSISATHDEACLQRFVRRHPDAAMYAGFADFNCYRVAIGRAHLVAGFGRIHWLDVAAFAFAGETAALAASEADIVGHMNQDHADAVQLYAERLLGRTAGDWVLTGVDPEGADLRRAGETARLWFDKSATDAEAARVELVRLVKRARETGAST